MKDVNSIYRTKNAEAMAYVILGGKATNGVLMHQSRSARAYHITASNDCVMWADRVRRRCVPMSSNVDNALVLYSSLALRIDRHRATLNKDASSN